MDDIRKTIETFAKERDIAVLLDGARLGEALLYTKPEADVTADFIAYFNEKNP